MGPSLVISQGNSGHSKQSFKPLVKAQLQIWQNLFARAIQPITPFGHVCFCIFGHFSQAIPQTPILNSKPFNYQKRPYKLISITTKIFFKAKQTLLPSLVSRLLEKSMFCPSCGRQNKDTAVFCEFCGKGLPQKNNPLPLVQPVAQANQNTKKAIAPKPRLSYNAKRGIITGLLIVGLILVVLLIFYPSIFPWNW